MGIRKSDLVEASLLEQLDEAIEWDDDDEIIRLKEELEYLHSHRDEY